MTVYMNVRILILLSFLNFLAPVADRTDNIASFEHDTHTHIYTYTHTHSVYTYSSRCFAIVYREYVHGIAIPKGTTKGRHDRISTRFCQFYFVVWSWNRHCDHCDSWIFIDRIYNRVLLVAWNFCDNCSIDVLFSSLRFFPFSLDFKIAWYNWLVDIDQGKRRVFICGIATDMV